MKLSTNQIHQEDCIIGMSKMPEACVDLVFADPPFNIGYEYDQYDDRRDGDEYLAWSRKWIESVIRVLKPEGAFWLAIGDEYAAELKVLCTRELGLHLRSWVIWFYTFGVHCKNKFTRSHAHLLYFVRDPKRFTFNSKQVRVPSARELVYGDKRADPDGRMPDDTWMIPPSVPTRDGFVLRPQDIPDRFPPESDTWFYSRVAGTFRERRGWHGCQMPEQLLGRIIRACSNEGEVVLDPFAGSGTTLAVARKLSRSFIGYELSAKYVQQIERRLAEVSPGEALNGPENAATSAPATKSGRTLNRAADRPARAEVEKSTSSPVRSTSASLGRIAVSLGELNTALIEAYLASSEGYAIDRVIADPELNKAYVQACGRLGVPLTPSECNHRLLGLRKAGRLSALPRPRKTAIAWESLEPFAFASEIAWQILADDDHSLDDILCDPKLAREFDKTASRFEPGYLPFQYRWAALYIRKQARHRRACAQNYKTPQQLRLRLRRMQTEQRTPTDIEPVAGLYAIRLHDQFLYIGDTENLRHRIASHYESRDALARFTRQNTPITITDAPFQEPKERRWGVQARLLGELSPRLNVRTQAYIT